jgi:phage baseplate assembly protein gpV
MSLEGEAPSQDAHLNNISFDKGSFKVYDLALGILMIILTSTFGDAIFTSKALVATTILKIYFDDSN